ncbi:hypothetical protein [Lepagella muris]|jgi:GT2 family glycosyltransferase|uniref:Uncharacterized protein n=2 Tax=Bacteria TaxID=2 RepID=A0AC61RB91_9BACT|nr:hypothetical protein [Lepagella muris]ROT09971.1 hypothetical protein EEL33_00845 [Muribaculaceae bacterium Isolate-037 (Harlan)]TGY76487.1 hypothetical protein E5331_17865 [Lepagella muris]THG47951.1 hypothetical protein E5984_16955 [Bacteroidales bacterium]TKC64338.1 hypothetical protein E5359_003295 [Bacteroidales bacterium]
MKVLFLCVNYNSYSHLVTFLNTIDQSLDAIGNQNVNVSICIGDASDMKRSIEYIPENFELFSFPIDNLGYFGGVNWLVNKIGKKYINEQDLVIISNVDLTISSDFFSQLSSIYLKYNKYAWIAPQIYSNAENRDKNPKILIRPSLNKMKALKLMYRFPVIHRLYEKTLYKRKKLRPKFSAIEIYAGHGAFIILTKEFFEKGGKIEYPIFLFGEEQYLAEEIQRIGMKVIYEPSLKIMDEEHASTGKMKRGSYYEYNYQAIKYILDTYYE